MADRARAEKEQAVLALLRDPMWSHWSDREIARQCGVSHSFVQDVTKRNGLICRAAGRRTYKNAQGVVTTMKTAAIGDANRGTQRPFSIREQAIIDQTSGPCIYLMTDGERCKIGCSEDLDARLRSLKGANPALQLLHAVPSADMYQVENTLHRCFHVYRVHNEWFAFPPELIARICACASDTALLAAANGGIVQIRFEL